MTAGQVTTNEDHQVPRSVYSCLPLLLQDGCSCFDRTAEMEVFLFAALPVLSRALPKSHIVLDDKDHQLALMTWIYGGSGMGKGAANHAMGLLDHLEARERQRNKDSEKEYLKAQAEGAEDCDPPTLVDINLPLRTTPSTLLARLDRNPANHTHLLTDTEGHALGNPANKDHGSIREILLKGAEGERDGQLWKKEGLVTVKVWLSMMVSSTKQHMMDGIKSTEDGLFSRIIWHRVPDGIGIYRDPRPSRHKSRATRIQELGSRVTAIYDKLQSTDGVSVQFTGAQYDEHVGIMQDFMRQAVDINADLEGVMGRLGKRVLRMAGIFSLLRKAEEDGPMHNTVVCDELSWSAAMQLTETIYESMMDVYHVFNPNAKKDSSEEPHDLAYTLVRRYVVDHPNILPKEAVQMLRINEEIPGVHMWLNDLSNANNSVRKLISKAKQELRYA